MYYIPVVTCKSGFSVYFVILRVVHTCVCKRCIKPVATSRFAAVCEPNQ